MYTSLRQVYTEVLFHPAILICVHDILREMVVWVWRFAFTYKLRDIHSNIQGVFIGIQQNTNYVLDAYPWEMMVSI